MVMVQTHALFPHTDRRERRKHARYAVHPPVRFGFVGGPLLRAHCEDMSLGGAFLRAATPALVGARIVVHVWVRVHAGGSAEHLLLDAVVRWTRFDGFGVQFGPMGARATHALVTFFQRADAGYRWEDALPPLFRASRTRRARRERKERFLARLARRRGPSRIDDGEA